VNGGYFDPTSKFGVNCYGIKPQGNVKLPTPLPGTDPSAFNDAVAKFKSMLKSFNLDPYSRTTWSGSVTAPVSKGEEFLKSITTEKFTMREHQTPMYEVLPGNTIANSGLSVNSPYGLIGNPGSTGPQGPMGPMGGDSTVPGPAGPMGPLGPVGPQGEKGDPGVSNIPGPTGPQGLEGPEGKAGAAAAAGATGPAGAPGAPGAPGAAGAPGAVGPMGPKGNEDGNLQLGGWNLNSTTSGDDLTVYKDGRQDFIFRHNNGWPEFWINRGGSWKKYD
jgi:hypothetical protein